MAEEDWYGPFANMNWTSVSFLVGGLFMAVLGLCGYTFPPRGSSGPAWIDHPSWPDIAFWLAVAAGGVLNGLYKKKRNP